MKNVKDLTPAIVTGMSNDVMLMMEVQKWSSQKDFNLAWDHVVMGAGYDLDEFNNWCAENIRVDEDDNIY